MSVNVACSDVAQRPLVALCQCSNYGSVTPAVQRCLEELGGLRSFLHPGSRTLVKVNLVSPHDAAAAVTTHPAIVAAVVTAVRNAGGIPVVGDSPALVSAKTVARKCGIADVCDTLQVPIIDLDEPVLVTNPRAKLVRGFRISRRLRDFDAIINVPKLKTHCLVGLTGAVKNLFGCIPGKLKTAQHVLQQDPIQFSEMLLDLHDTIPPPLTIVDAVVGMEGPGPGAGTPRQMGLVIAGRSSLAVDAVCAEILGFSQNEVPFLRIARKRGIREASLRNIDVCGAQLARVAIGDLKKPRASLTTMLPGFVMHLGKRHLMNRPVAIRDRCVLCGHCLSICAAGAVTLTDAGPRFDSRRCLRCYCCHEICPAQAISLQGGLLSRVLDSSAL